MGITQDMSEILNIHKIMFDYIQFASTPALVI